jgi:hypothetical protein
MKINNIDFYEKERVLKDLSHKIAIVGASDIYPNEADSTCIVISIKGNTNNVKSILKRYFDVSFKRVYCAMQGRDRMFATREDILSICKVFIENNLGHLVEYNNQFDPMQEENTIDKRVYRYGQVNYEWLCV